MLADFAPPGFYTLRNPDLNQKDSDLWNTFEIEKATKATHRSTGNGTNQEGFISPEKTGD
jgi:hypothetical protein